MKGLQDSGCPRCLARPFRRGRPCLHGLVRWWRPDMADELMSLAAASGEKKYMHVPTHAADDFMKTTTTARMRRSNSLI